jgi:hypothetical protein
MENHGILYHVVEFIESLPDRPLLLLLFIMGSALLFLPLGLLAKKLARLLADKAITALGGAGEEEMGKIGAMVYGGADADGRINGIPARLTAGPVMRRGAVIGYQAEFAYSVANPAGMKLVVHRAGLLNRPLEALPPEVPEIPEGLKAAGYTLRCAPPEQALTAAGRAGVLALFASGGDLTEIILEGGELKVRLYSGSDWEEGELRALLEGGAEAAKAFN